MDVLCEVLPYLKHMLNLVNAEILSCEEELEHDGVGKAGYSHLVIDSSELGSPAFKFRDILELTRVFISFPLFSGGEWGIML
jgi:hypothetical protein